LSREEGTTLLDEMAQRADQERDRVERFVRQQVSHALDTAGLASREEIVRLEGRIDGLESRLRDLSFSVAAVRAGEAGGSASQPDSAEPSEDTARSGSAAITVTPGRADAGTSKEE
jgi:BMFP domain-containing protein YqiC